MRLAGKKILMVVAPEAFRDEELLTPRDLFEKAGAAVTIASTRTGQARGMHGTRVVATRNLDMCGTSDFDAVAIAGGDGAATFLWAHPGLRSLVTEAARELKLVAAICLAPVVLARAGLLQGINATVWPRPNAESEIRRAGGRLTDDAAVVAGRIITGRGPEAAELWAQAVIRTLSP